MFSLHLWKIFHVFISEKGTGALERELSLGKFLLPTFLKNRASHPHFDLSLSSLYPIFESLEKHFERDSFIVTWKSQKNSQTNPKKPAGLFKYVRPFCYHQALKGWSL